MRLLSEAVASGVTHEGHLTNRAVHMQQALVKAFQKSTTSPTAISRMVTYLFRDRSLGHAGVILAPFLDLGFIYRTFSELDGSIEAFPICLSTETALIGLWKEAGLLPRLNLQECIAESNGADFEALIFHTLVLKHSNEFRMLPCACLGYFGGVENLAVKIDVVHTSSLSTNASATVAGEINTLHAVAKRKKITYTNVQREMKVSIFACSHKQV